MKHKNAHYFAVILITACFFACLTGLGHEDRSSILDWKKVTIEGIGIHSSFQQVESIAQQLHSTEPARRVTVKVNNGRISLVSSHIEYNGRTLLETEGVNYLYNKTSRKHLRKIYREDLIRVFGEPSNGELPSNHDTILYRDSSSKLQSELQVTLHLKSRHVTSFELSWNKL